MTLDITKTTQAYTVKRLGEEDFPAILALYGSNPQYFAAMNQPVPEGGLEEDLENLEDNIKSLFFSIISISTNREQSVSFPPGCFFMGTKKNGFLNRSRFTYLSTKDYLIKSLPSISAG